MGVGCFCCCLAGLGLAFWGGCGVWLLGAGWGVVGLVAAVPAGLGFGAADRKNVGACMVITMVYLAGVEVGFDAGADGAGGGLDSGCELAGFAAGFHLYAKSWLGCAFCAAFAQRCFGWRSLSR